MFFRHLSPLRLQLPHKHDNIRPVNAIKEAPLWYGKQSKAS